MKTKPGVFIAKKKDGTIYFRSSITYKSKHISLGSFSSEEEAHSAYLDALKLLSDASETIDHYHTLTLSFEKDVSLLNFRDHGIYSANPIYVQKHFFRYYISKHDFLTFDIDDLFYYSSHKIMCRGGHLFVADYGMQVNILNRYGIKNYAVLDRDYRFLNGDTNDFRYSNIEIINRYAGVRKISDGIKITYKTTIHLRGDYLVGIYDSETEAAIAYNKAVDILKSNGITKNFAVNYIEDLPASKYADIYADCAISPKIIAYRNQ